MDISVTTPIGQAMERAKGMLFRPFDLAKWFVIGFCAWLATLGEGGGGGGNVRLPGGWGGGRGGTVGTGGGGGTPATAPSADEVAHVLHLVVQNAFWIVPVAAVGLALVVVLMWVSARGKFMFLEAVAYNRAAVVEPWKRLRPLANQFFRFQLVLAVVALAVVAGVALASVLVALPDVRARQFGGGAALAVFGGGALLLGAALFFGLVGVVAEDFLIPLMYLRGSGVGPAWREFRGAILPGNAGVILLFYLMRIVLGMVSAAIMFFGMCCTCFVAALPYLSAVVFLPIYVFNRSYSLYFLRQFGPQYNLLVEVVAPVQVGFQVVMPPAPEATPSAPPAPPPPGSPDEMR